MVHERFVFVSQCTTYCLSDSIYLFIYFSLEFWAVHYANVFQAHGIHFKSLTLSYSQLLNLSALLLSITCIRGRFCLSRHGLFSHITCQYRSVWFLNHPMWMQFIVFSHTHAACLKRKEKMHTEANLSNIKVQIISKNYTPGTASPNKSSIYCTQCFEISWNQRSNEEKNWFAK